MSYQDLLGPLPESPIGHDFDPSRATESFVPTARAVVFQPKEFFAALPRQGNYVGPIVFFVICAVVSSIISGILGLLSGHTIGALITGIIGGAIFGTVGLVIISAIAHLLVTFIVGSNNAGFEATLRVVAYSAVTALVSWIPIVGGLIALYGVYIAIVGIREMHQTTTGKAALVVLIPAAIVLVLLLVVALIAGVALLGLSGGAR
jgi:hypothetical protein